MGMDIHARNPTGERGAYFRNNVWWWRPLADYCITVAPDICAPVDAGRTAAYAAFAYPGDPHLFVENVTDFVAFLRKSGGFEVW